MSRALLLLVLLAPVAHAQWAWDAELGVGTERADNLFRAPDVLRADEAVRDSVLQDDLVLPVRATVEAERAWGRQSVAVRYDLGLDRYASAGHLDGETHALRLTAEAERGAFEGRLEGRWRRTERVGVHVLGDIRPQLFRYTQPEARARLRWTPSTAHRLSLEARARHRAYGVSMGPTPLDHVEASAEAAWRVRRRADRRTHWALEASVRARERAYDALAARGADGSRDPEAPRTRLVYLEAELDADLAVSRTLTVSADAGARVRRDPFEGYYSYASGAGGAALAWAPRDGLEVEVGGQYRRVRYGTQPAPQAEGPEPPLRYHYLRWGLEATVEALPGLEVTAFADGTRRLSNVSRETLLFRRSYRTSVVGLAVAVDLRRAVGHD